MFNGNEGPAARIRSDDRGAWTGTLTLAPGVRRSWFRAERTLGEILDGVADVALAVCLGNHENALSLSKAEWDAGRLKSGRSDLPTAQTIRQRLRLSWQRTLELAFADPHARATVLAHWSGAKADALGANGPALAKRTLCAVALRLGHLPARFEYDEVVRQMGAASRRLKNAQRREFSRSTLERTIPLRLPSSTFLAATFGTWSAVLAASGAADQLPEITPTKPPSAADTLDHFIDVYGVVPAATYFEKWCRRMDIPLPDTKLWSEVVLEVWRRRYERGVPTPSNRTLSRDCPPLPDPVTRERRHRHQITMEDTLASLRLYAYLYLESTSLPRANHYRAACLRDRRLVWPGDFRRFGLTFQEMCQRAGIV